MFPETEFIESTTEQFFLENVSPPPKTASHHDTVAQDAQLQQQGRGIAAGGDAWPEAILMGTRSTDPDGRWLNGIFWPSSNGWPPFMRVNPCLDWSYHDVWVFLRFFGIPYCALYDAGYTSIGSRSTSQPNPHLRVAAGSGDEGTEDEEAKYLPAYKLSDGSLERAGRR